MDPIILARVVVLWGLGDHYERRKESQGRKGVDGRWGQPVVFGILSMSCSIE